MKLFSLVWCVLCAYAYAYKHPVGQRECATEGEPSLSMPLLFNDREYLFPRGWHGVSGYVVPKETKGESLLPLQVQMSVNAIQFSGLPRAFACIALVTDPNREQGPYTYSAYTLLSEEQMQFSWNEPKGNGTFFSKHRSRLRYEFKSSDATMPTSTCVLENIDQGPLAGEDHARFRIRVRLLSQTQQALELGMTLRAHELFKVGNRTNALIRVGNMPCSTSLYTTYPEVELDRLPGFLSSLAQPLPLRTNTPNSSPLFHNFYDPNTHEDGVEIVKSKPSLSLCVVRELNDDECRAFRRKMQRLEEKPENYVTVGGRTYALDEASFSYDRQVTSGLESTSKFLQIVQLYQQGVLDAVSFARLYPWDAVIPSNTALVVNNNVFESVPLAAAIASVSSPSKNKAGASSSSSSSDQKSSSFALLPRSTNGWIWLKVFFPQARLHVMLGVFREYSFTPDLSASSHTRLPLVNTTYAWDLAMGFVSVERPERVFGPRVTLPFVLEEEHNRVYVYRLKGNAQEPEFTFTKTELVPGLPGYAAAISFSVPALGLDVSCRAPSARSGQPLFQIIPAAHASLFSDPFGTQEAGMICTYSTRSSHQTETTYGWLEENYSSLF